MPNIHPRSGRGGLPILQRQPKPPPRRQLLFVTPTDAMAEDAMAEFETQFGASPVVAGRWNVSPLDLRPVAEQGAALVAGGHGNTRPEYLWPARPRHAARNPKVPMLNRQRALSHQEIQPTN
jgi:hypothetical protein